MRIHKNFQDIGELRKDLSGGLDPNELDEGGNTRLHNAPTVEMVKLLISFGADSSIKNLAGNTPIDNNTDKLQFGSEEFKQKTREIINILKNPHMGVVELIEDSHNEIKNLKLVIDDLKRQNNVITEENKKLRSASISECPKCPKCPECTFSKVWECKNPVSRLSTSVEDRLDTCEPDSTSLSTNGNTRFSKRTDCMKNCVV